MKGQTRKDREALGAVGKAVRFAADAGKTEDEMALLVTAMMTISGCRSTPEWMRSAIVGICQSTSVWQRVAVERARVAS